MAMLLSSTIGLGIANTLPEHTVYVLISQTTHTTSLATQPIWQRQGRTSTSQL